MSYLIDEGNDTQHLLMGNEAIVRGALEAGINVASGLHERLVSHPGIVAAAQRNGRHLFDARTPPETPVGTGLKRAGRRLLTVGTDCSIGKMFTALALLAVSLEGAVG